MYTGLEQNVGLLANSSAINCLSHGTTQVHAATEHPKNVTNIAFAVMRETGPLQFMFTALRHAAV
jgi:hypothetical protein